jgi:Zn-dependent protease with chaperone function
MNSSLYRVLSVLYISLLLAVSLAFAQVVQRDPAEEAPYIEELQKLAPKAVDAFKTGTEKLDSGNPQDAIPLFNDVLKQAPNYDPAMRRLGYALVETGKRQDGLAMIQKALDRNRSADNLTGMAYALMSSDKSGPQPSTSDSERALSLVEEASKLKNGSDPQALAMIAELSLDTNKIDKFNATVGQLRAKFPDLVQTHYFNGIKLANDGDFDRAIAEIKIAESIGFPHDNAAAIISEMEKVKADSQSGLVGYVNYFYAFAAVVAVWALGLLSLFVMGRILSAKTLHAIESSDPNDITGGGQAGLRSFYRKLVTTAGIYYYVSQPIVMLLVLVFTVGIIFFFFWIGTIPIKLVLIIGFVGAATIFYMFKSLLIRPKIEDPGRVLKREEAPKFWELVEHVAQTINTRPVDEVRLTEGNAIAVYERGGFRAKMQDKAERILIVGVATLNDFRQNAFRAVLAHEYGHFSHRDTAGGDVAFRVNTDIVRLANAMAQSGTATYYNLAFQFIRLYHFLFRRITLGATRLQEVLADRVAVYHYGAPAFCEGLEHVVRREVEFEHVATKELNAAFSANRAVGNLYELKADEGERQNLEKDIDTAINRPTTLDDSHPCPADRFRLAKKIISKEAVTVDGLIWDLFNNKEQIASEMSKMLDDRVREARYGSSHTILK